MYKKISRNMQWLSMITIILTAAIVLGSNYTFLNMRIKNETKSFATVIASMLNVNGGNVSTLSSLDTLNEFRITIYGSERKLIFDSIPSLKATSFENNAALKAAEEYGSGESQGHFTPYSKNTYSYAVRLENGLIVQVSGTASLVTKIFAPLIAPLVLMFVLIYIFCVILSWFLTENITKPINEISLTDFDNPKRPEIYPELAPLMNKIKAQNNEIERQMVKLKTRKTRFQTVSENINEGVLILDADCNILSMNKSAEKIFGASEESVIHTPFSKISKDNDLLSALKSARMGNNGFIVTRLGEKAFNAFYSPVFENGAVCGIVLLLLDITEKLESENMRKEFTANVSHELKTPLTTILGYSQIINNGIAKPEDIVGFSKKIEKEASRLITLIDDIIKLSHLDEQKNIAENHPVHILPLVNDILDRLRISAKQKDVLLEYAGSDFVLNGDLMQISELIYNLCDNAIKYNVNGGKVSVTTGSRFIKVTDTGIGIPEEYHERIFERFFRVDKSRSKSVNGTGLGLSIVKHIAEQYNAQITIDSALGKGTTITVSFD